MQWGEEYRELHVAVWTECRRVLKPGGIFVLNMKDHIRKGVLQEVTKWHAVALLMLGFVCTRRVHVPCPGQRHGANGHLRWSMRACCSSDSQRMKQPASDLSPSFQCLPNWHREKWGSGTAVYPSTMVVLCERVLAAFDPQPLVCRPFCRHNGF